MKQSRRTFIKNISIAGLAASTVSFPFISYGRSLSKQGKLGIALVGLGYYSTDLLAPGLQQTENCYLAGIVTGTAEKRIYTTTRISMKLQTTKTLILFMWYYQTACIKNMSFVLPKPGNM